MTLKGGKHYRNRRGAIIGPIRSSGRANLSSSVEFRFFDSLGRSYRIGGQWLPHEKQTGLDLIEEIL